MQPQPQQPVTPFDYTLVEGEGSAGKKGDASHLRDLDVLRRVGVFIRERIIAKTAAGKLPDARIIAVRLLVLQELLDPKLGYPFPYIAHQLGCSRAYVSQVGCEFADTLGMRASWQRSASRKLYAERARGVHAGTWVASEKWERRKVREAKAKAAKAKAAKARNRRGK